MADYKELLRKAVEALPENNGAARRAVYEKARAALVGQLRAINPPLAARDITAHRLQLEDCIRQVEQEASEAVIAGLGSAHEESPPPPPVYFEPPARKVAAAPPPSKPVAKAPPSPVKEPPRPLPAGNSIEEIIAAANADQAEPVPEAPRTLVRPAAKAPPKLVPQPRAEAKPAPKPEPRPEVRQETRQDARPETRVRREAPARLEVQESLEDQLSAPEEDIGASLERMVPPPTRVVPKSPAAKAMPSIVARAEAAKARPASPSFGASIDGPRRGPVLEPRRESAAAAARAEALSVAAAPGYAPRPAMSLDDEEETSAIHAALSSVREVEVESLAETPSVDPQGAIDRAIATLDREARGDIEDGKMNGQSHNGLDESFPPPPPPVAEERRPAKKGLRALAEDVPPANVIAPPQPARPPREAPPAAPAKFAPQAKSRGTAGRRNLALEADSGFPKGREERRGISAITIFLIVFAVLIVGVGGAGIWAWREGFLNLDSMFGRSAAVTEQAATPAKPSGTETAEAPATGPGNTATPADTKTSPVELKQEERIATDPTVAQSQSTALPLQDPNKAGDRLGGDTSTDPNSAQAAVAAIDPATAAGSQSLLLEAQANGKTGAIPFSGTVEWSKGTDEMGLPTLVGKANIPARNLGVDVLIRKNSDPSLPASHLMEINFRVNESFVGGSIAQLPGVLLKNEELVQGTPLIGASARVVGNSFLFALSASPEDITTNTGLLTSRKWIDLALVYASGQRAIVTLEKDDKAEALFNEVVGAWNKTAGQ